MEQRLGVKIEHGLHVEVDLAHLHLVGDALGPTPLVQQKAMPDSLVLEEGRGAVEHDHLDLSIGVGLQVRHELELPLYALFALHPLVEEDGHVHIAELVGSAARH